LLKFEIEEGRSPEIL